MKINNNIPSLVARNALSKANAGADKASKKLSTGKRVNSAADDPAGLAIINKIKTQVKGLEMADRNVGDAISLIQTAEGGLAEIQNMLQRMRELAVQGANDTLTDINDTAGDTMQSDRQKIQEEINQLIDEIDKTAGKIQFNTKPLLNAGATFTFQVGPNREGTNSAYGMELKVDMVSVDAVELGLRGGITQAGKDAMIDKFEKDVIDSINTDISDLEDEIGVPSDSTAVPPVVATGLYAALEAVRSAVAIPGSPTPAEQDAIDDAQSAIDTAEGELADSQKRLAYADVILADLQNIAVGALTQAEKDALIAKLTDPINTDISDLEVDISDLEDSLGVPGDSAAVPPVAATGLYAVLEAAKSAVVNPGSPTPAEQTLIDNAQSNIDTAERDLATANGKLAVSQKALADANVILPDIQNITVGNLDYTERDVCANAISSCDRAIGIVSQFRSNLGAIQNRLEYTQSAIGVSSENATTSLGRIEDTDMAKEMTEYSTRNVLVQAGLAVLAQANQRPQQVLQILQ